MSRAPRIAALCAALCGAAPAFAAPGVQVGDLSTVVVSLALVVGFIFAAAFVAKRTPFGMNAKRNGPLKVVAALPLGPKERLLLVEARGEQLLIAVSPAGVFNVGVGNVGVGNVGLGNVGASAPGAPSAPAAPVFQLGDAQ